MDSIRSALTKSLAVECLGVCESCEITFSSLRPCSRRSAQFLSTCTHSISHSWLTSSHLFLSDAIILDDVMQGWLSFWRCYHHSSFLTDKTTNICGLSAELLCRMLGFMVYFLFLVTNSLLEKHVRCCELDFSARLCLHRLATRIIPEFHCRASKSVALSRLSSSTSHSRSSPSRHLPLTWYTIQRDIKAPRKLISLSGLLAASLIGSRPKNFNLCRGKFNLIVKRCAKRVDIRINLEITALNWKSQAFVISPV